MGAKLVRKIEETDPTTNVVTYSEEVESSVPAPRGDWIMIKDDSWRIVWIEGLVTGGYNKYSYDHSVFDEAQIKASPCVHVPAGSPEMRTMVWTLVVRAT